METRSAKRRKLRNPNHSSETNTGEDRITDLSDAILHRILFLLPIKSIIQTSILSKRWRTIWHTFPDLDFTSIVPTGTAFKKIVSSKNLCNENVITRILSLRDKLSDVRSLRFNACMSFSGLQALIRNAVRLGVQELDIEVETSDTFNFPRSIITHDCLRVLKVKADPSFRLPPSRIMRSGFQTLQFLSLSDVHIEYNQSSLLDMFVDGSFPQLKKLHLKSWYDLVYLRVGCRVLEELVLKNCSSLQGLEILSPRLVTLKVSSCFGAFDVEDTWVQLKTPRLHTLVWVDNPITSKNYMQNLLCLHEATIDFIVSKQDIDAKKLQGLSSFLSGISYAVSLTLECPFVKIVAKNNPLLHILFNPFVKLNSLELQTIEVMCLASVLKVCPIIDTLIINITHCFRRERSRNRLSWDLSSSWVENYWETQTKDLKPLLHHLRVIKIQGVSESSIGLVKVMLQHGKVLQDLILTSGKSNSNGCLRHEKLKARIMAFSRGSLDTKLAFH